MLQIAQKMLRENSLCVLATCSNDFPNSSLMQYIYDSSGMKIFMLTQEDSVKHHNIMANPHVSLLIDTRTESLPPELPVMALTVYGEAEIVNDSQRHQILVGQLVAKYSNLRYIASYNQCLVIQVKTKKMLLLDGVSDKTMIEIQDI